MCVCAEQLHDLDQFVIVANHNSHARHAAPHEHAASTTPQRHAPRGRGGPLRQIGLSFPMDESAAGPGMGGSSERPQKRPWTTWRARSDAGHSLILYPEGTRGEPGELAPFHTGIGRLLEQHPELPVIPAHILGPERALPRGASVPLPVWNRVILGPAMRLHGQPRDVTDTLRGNHRGAGARGAIAPPTASRPSTRLLHRRHTRHRRLRQEHLGPEPRPLAFPPNHRCAHWRRTSVTRGRSGTARSSRCPPRHCDGTSVAVPRPPAHLPPTRFRNWPSSSCVMSCVPNRGGGTTQPGSSWTALRCST